MSIDVGDKAPAVTLPASGGGELSLAKLKGKPVVVYFYPKDNTTGCTREAQDFQAAMPKF
jgi:peroxiredoxin Q/BCP